MPDNAGVLKTGELLKQQLLTSLMQTEVGTLPEHQTDDGDDRPLKQLLLGEDQCEGFYRRLQLIWLGAWQAAPDRARLHQGWRQHRLRLKVGRNCGLTEIGGRGCCVQK